MRTISPHGRQEASHCPFATLVAFASTLYNRKVSIALALTGTHRQSISTLIQRDYMNQSTSTARFRLETKVAVVTGGTRGIGEGIVRRFAEEGAKVVFSGRSHEKGKLSKKN